MQRYGGVTLLGTGSRNQFRVSVFGVAGGPANQEPSAYELMLQDAGLDAAADVGELAEVPAAY